MIAVVIFFCTYEPHQTDVRMIYDVTDVHLSRPDTTHTIRLYRFEKSIWHGGNFAATRITDVDFNTKFLITIEAPDFWTHLLSNEIVRRNEVRKFQDKIKESIHQLTDDTASRNNSSIYRVIAREYNMFFESNSNKKILQVYSDLRENSDVLNLYSKDTALLKNNPDSIITLFEKELPLKHIENVEVFFLYQPTTTEANKYYLQMTSIYRTMLEKKGAKVEIQSNL